MDSGEQFAHLEHILQKEAHISWKDRASVIGDNIKRNASYFIPFGVFLGIGGLVAWDIMELLQHNSLVDNYQQAKAYIGNISRNIETATDMGRTFPVSSEIMEVPLQLIEEGKEYTAKKEATELIHYIKEQQHILDNSNPQESIKYLNYLQEKLNPIVNHGKEFWLTIGAICGGILDGVGLILSGIYALNEPYWTSELREKKRLKKKLKDLPELREDLENHPRPDLLVDVVEGVICQDNTGSYLYHLTKKFIQKSNKDNMFILDTILNDGYESHHLMDPFKTYSCFDSDRDERYKSIEKQLLDEGWSQKDIEDSLETVDTYKGIFKELFQKEWNPSQIQNVLTRVGNLENHREYFLEALLTEKKESFLNALSFYEEFKDIEETKRLQFAGVLLQNLNYSRSLKRCKISSPSIVKYITDLDNTLGISKKNQLRMLGKVNNLHNLLEQLGQKRKVHALIDIVNYELPQFNDDVREITNFLVRHQDVDAGETLTNMGALYKFRDGSYKSRLLKKEEPVDAKPLLTRKGEQKVVEELRSKARFARYEAFNSRLDDLFHAPLEEIVGHKVDSITWTEELINSVSGYYSIENNELASIVSKVIGHYIFNDMDNLTLEGNRTLEEKLGPAIISWKEGHTSTHQCPRKKKIRKKLGFDLRHEYDEFARCMHTLTGNHQMPNSAKVAEAIYKRVLRQANPEDRAVVQEAKYHLTKIKQDTGVLHKGSQITFYDSKDFMDSLQMGNVTGSCTNLVNGSNKFAAFVNAIDDNKKVVYLANENGTKVGRTLAVLTDIGIVTYRSYENTIYDINEAWLDHFRQYARKVGVPLIIPERFAEEGLVKHLGKKQKVSPLIHRAACPIWYDDGMGTVKIPEEGYNPTFSAYIEK
ncbi:MAG: hypothetical protein ACLFP2_03965 [Candidatus Woesearchaeota archaeon]